MNLYCLQLGADCLQLGADRRVCLSMHAHVSAAEHPPGPCNSNAVKLALQLLWKSQLCTRMCAASQLPAPLRVPIPWQLACGAHHGCMLLLLHYLLCSYML